MAFAAPVTNSNPAAHATQVFFIIFPSGLSSVPNDRINA
jgi:hypothetical protein